MTLGLVVRDDNGGLGNLTLDAFINLRPDVTLIVQSRPCRGEPHPALFEEAWTTTVYSPNPVEPSTWEKLAGKADVWWTAETWYCDDAESILTKAGCKSILYAMPELFRGSQATEVWNPTDYLTERARLGDVMPWPCNPPKRWRVKKSVKRIFHVVSGATQDRNGTLIFLEALRHVEAPVEVMLHDPDKMMNPQQWRGMPSNVALQCTHDYVHSLQTFYVWADLLVLPRRYAGLCLPAFEAFGYGCLVMMPDVDPQVRWPIIGVPASHARPVRLIGGKIPKWDIDPLQVAKSIDRACNAPEEWVSDRSNESRDWAVSRSWEMVVGKWKNRVSEKT
jgi:hypothetical protein